jgi:hypothetical protein
VKLDQPGHSAGIQPVNVEEEELQMAVREAGHLGITGLHTIQSDLEHESKMQQSHSFLGQSNRVHSHGMQKKGGSDKRRYDKKRL